MIRYRGRIYKTAEDIYKAGVKAGKDSAFRSESKAYAKGFKDGMDGRALSYSRSICGYCGYEIPSMVRRSDTGLMPATFCSHCGMRLSRSKRW